MATDNKHCFASNEIEKTRASTATFNEEGQVVVRSMNTTSGEEEATRGTAASGLVIIGFSKLDTVSPADTEVIAEEGLTVPATADSDGFYLVTLEHDTVTSQDDANGDVAVYDVTNDAWLAVGAAIANGTFVLSSAADGVLKFHSAQAGIEFNVFYRRTLTARQAQQKYQRRHINSDRQADLSLIGIYAGVGEIYTDQYDLSVGDWSTGTLSTGAVGHVTMGGSGTDISSKVRVIKVPTVDSPYLGLAFNI